MGDEGLRPGGERKKLSENMAFCPPVVSGLAGLALLPADSNHLAVLLGTVHPLHLLGWGKLM